MNHHKKHSQLAGLENCVWPNLAGWVKTYTFTSKQ